MSDEKVRRLMQMPGGFNLLRMTRLGPFLFNRHDVYIGRSIAKYGEYNYSEANIMRQLIKPGMVAVDVGANMGVHTLLMAQLVGPDGRVYAYEPQRLMFQTMCANLALNQCANVHARHAAVGERAGTAMIPELKHDKRTNFGRVSLGEGGEKITVVTLDGEELPACNFLKVDVEGMEAQALRGAAQTIRRFKPLMYVENDRRDLSQELIRTVLDLEYRAWWCITPLFSERNFHGDPANIFPDRVSVNLICLPRAARLKPDHTMRPVSGPDDWWKPEDIETDASPSTIASG